MATVTIKGKGDQKPLHFKKGGLHESTHTPAGQKISAAKRSAALHGKFGAKARKQELFAQNVLHH